MSGKIDDRTLINLLRLRIEHTQWHSEEAKPFNWPKRIYGVDRRHANFRNLIAVGWARYNPENRINVIITKKGLAYLNDLDNAANKMEGYED